MRKALMAFQVAAAQIPQQQRHANIDGCLWFPSTRQNRIYLLTL